MIALSTTEALDLAIGRMIYAFTGHRGISRGDLYAELCSGAERFQHGLKAIADCLHIPRFIVNERVSAFIEAEKEEEEAQRIARAIEQTCRREDAA